MPGNRKPVKRKTTSGRLLKKPSGSKPPTKNPDRKRAGEFLWQGEEQFRAVAQNARAVFGIVQGTRLVYGNPYLAELSGYTTEELLSMDFSQVFHPTFRKMVRERARRRLRGETVPSHYELLLLSKDGEEHWMDFTNTLIEYRGKPAIIGIGFDITDRKRMEQTLRESESRNKTISELMTDYVFVVDVDPSGLLKLRWASESMSRLTGRTVEDAATSEMWRSMIHPDDADRFFAFVQRTVTTAEKGTLECRTFTKQGNERWTRLFVQPQTDKRGVVTTIVGAAQDITERRHIQQSLRESEKTHLDQMRKLARQAEKLLEDERADVSRQLHDGVGQSLTSHMMRLAWLEKRIRTTDPLLGDELKQACEQAGQIINDIRTVAKSLRPVAVEHEGLIPAIRSYVTEFQRLSGIKCRVVVQPRDVVVKEPFATALYRIVQEAITNVARHANASCCEIHLKISRNQLELTVLDNGRGARDGVLDGHQSLGILGMRERTTAVGGDLRVENGPKGGVLVRACFPLKSNRPVTKVT